MNKFEKLFYETIILFRYSWFFFWKGGAYANEYLRAANFTLKEIEENRKHE